MNKYLIGLLVVFNLISNDMLSQENIRTNFYQLKVPENTTVKIFAETHEELANIDVYQFNVAEKPKYILYLMSNKTNIEITTIDINNYKDFLFDLGSLKVSKIENLEKKLKINFLYTDKEKIRGIVYLSVKNNILNRFVFLFPNENANQVFQREVDEMMDSVIDIKDYW